MLKKWVCLEIHQSYFKAEMIHLTCGVFNLKRKKYHFLSRKKPISFHHFFNRNTFFVFLFFSSESSRDECRRHQQVRRQRLLQRSPHSLPHKLTEQQSQRSKSRFRFVLKCFSLPTFSLDVSMVSIPTGWIEFWVPQITAYLDSTNKRTSFTFSKIFCKNPEHKIFNLLFLFSLTVLETSTGRMICWNSY